MAAGGGRVVNKRFLVQWNGSTWTDESAYIVSVDGKAQLAPPGAAIMAGKGMVAQMTVNLANESGRFSILNTAGPLYNGAGYLRPCTFDVQIDGGAWVRVFTGVVKSPQETVLADGVSPVVKLDCRGRDELLLNRRQSTPMGTFVALRYKTEADIIRQWLLDAGLSAGDMSIDPGLVSISEAWLDDESIADDAWQLAAAAGGRFYCAADGVFRYENALNWLFSPHSTTQQTYAYHYRQCTFDLRDSDLYSDITVEANTRVTGEAGELWTPDEPVVIPPNSSKTITCQYRYPAAVVYGPIWSAASPGGQNLASAVTLTAYTYYAQRAILTWNNTAAAAAVIHGLAIMGQPLIGGPSHEEQAASTASFWTNRARRSRRVSNIYIQSVSQAKMLAAILRDWSEAPRVYFSLQNAVGNPARRLGDRVTLNDAGAGSSMDGFIISLGFKFSAQTGFTQNLECVAAAGLYPHQAEGYFVIGTHTLIAGSKPIFY
jgi:hypothetical protein